MKYHVLNPSDPNFEQQLTVLRERFAEASPDNLLSVVYGRLDNRVVALVKAPGPGGAEDAPTDFSAVRVRELAVDRPVPGLRRIHGLVNGETLREVEISASHVTIGCAIWTVSQWRDHMAAGRVLSMYGAGAQAWVEEHLESVLSIAESIQKP